jgi:hypothetical protein
LAAALQLDSQKLTCRQRAEPFASQNDARAVVSGISFMSRLRYPHEIFSSVPSALAWIDQQQPEPGRYRRDQLERAIEQLRDSAR